MTVKHDAIFNFVRDKNAQQSIEGVWSIQNKGVAAGNYGVGLAMSRERNEREGQGTTIQYVLWDRRWVVDN